ncbi:MAG TPA: hypothetical protein VIZ17_12865 [Acetobacteraceae bacterium]|jgi:hypothetical protein
MDIQTPDHTPPRSAGSPGQPSPNFIAHVMQTLGAATDQQRDATRELFEALDPRDPADAQLAAIAVAAAQSAMDNFARAARPGVSDETAVRLRGSALAAGRAYATALRYLRKPQAMAAQPAKPARSRATPASAPQPPPAEPAGETQEIPPGFIALRRGATPIPAVFRPRDRFGNEIPDWRRDLMTPAQALAAFSYPPDPAQVAAAIAEEAAMMAKQPKPDTPRIPDVSPAGGAR